MRRSIGARARRSSPLEGERRLDPDVAPDLLGERRPDRDIRARLAVERRPDDTRPRLAGVVHPPRQRPTPHGWRSNRARPRRSPPAGDRSTPRLRPRAGRRRSIGAPTAPSGGPAPIDRRRHGACSTGRRRSIGVRRWPDPSAAAIDQRLRGRRGGDRSPPGDERRGRGADRSPPGDERRGRGADHRAPGRRGRGRGGDRRRVERGRALFWCAATASRIGLGAVRLAFDRRPEADERRPAASAGQGEQPADRSSASATPSAATRCATWAYRPERSPVARGARYAGLIGARRMHMTRTTRWLLGLAHVSMTVVGAAVSREH